MDHDAKSLYSETSNYYVENNRSNYSYEKSKERESKYGSLWEKQKVNINDIVDEFTPNFHAKESGSKIRFIDDDYQVVADMAAGYLRIYDCNSKTYVKLDGNPGKASETHFKIKKREEM